MTSFDANSYYRPNDDALRLIATAGTLAQWRSAGTGPKFIKLAEGRGSRIIYHGQDLVDWLAQKRIPVAA